MFVRDVAESETAVGRRALAGRSQSVADGLIDATIEELREIGYDRLSIRSVGRRAGVSHATTYGYFSSKQHLVAEAYWRRIQQWQSADNDGDDALTRLTTLFDRLSALLAAEPALTSAAMSAVLSSDPDVARLRHTIGATTRDRLNKALGDESTPDVLDSIHLSLNGVLLEAGAGHDAFDHLSPRLMTVVRLILRGSNSTQSSTKGNS